MNTFGHLVLAGAKRGSYNRKNKKSSIRLITFHVAE